MAQEERIPRSTKMESVIYTPLHTSNNLGSQEFKNVVKFSNILSSFLHVLAIELCCVAKAEVCHTVVIRLILDNWIRYPSDDDQHV